MKNDILVSWVGHHDLWGLDLAIGDEELTRRVEAIIGRKRPAGRLGDGPVKTLVSQREFGEIYFLSQWQDDVVNRRFVEWLKVRANFRFIGKDRLTNPTCYEQVFNVAKGELEAIRKENPNGQLHILLSPGTPTMAAVWVLLGKTSFPASFFQTYDGKVTEESIPFDITLDVIPEYLRGPDARWKQLAFASPGEVEGFEQIIGNSRPMQRAKRRAQRASKHEVSVLLTGESGTGKEKFARAIHRASPRGRDDRDFVRFSAVNCAAIPRELLESELFGHEKGSFTGAHKQYIGAFERANGGTLFLDEVGELSLEHQAKLLRALQPVRDEGPCACVVRRVGGERDISCDVRIVAATNRDLVEAIRKHQFRADLFYRLAVFPIRLPALWEIKPDLEKIALNILRRVNDDFKTTDRKWDDRRLMPDALKRLRKHKWPGNVRELQNVLAQAAVLALSSEITGAEIDSAIASFQYSADEAVFSRTRGDDFRLPDRIAEIRRIFIQDALDEAESLKDAADLLGVSPQLVSKAKQEYGVT